MEAYLRLSAGGQAFGGVFKKSAEEPVPFWLLYFNVDDLDAAVERVRAGGGKAFCNEEELPGGLSVAQCADPQGAAFALQGKRGHAPKVGWRTEWRGFSSSGRLVAPKPRRESDQ
jgi:predicted enzyme related to lactoylglutathione lyase